MFIFESILILFCFGTIFISQESNKEEEVDEDEIEDEEDKKEVENDEDEQIDDKIDQVDHEKVIEETEETEVEEEKKSKFESIIEKSTKSETNSSPIQKEEEKIENETIEIPNTSKSVIKRNKRKNVFEQCIWLVKTVCQNHFLNNQSYAWIHEFFLHRKNQSDLVFRTINWSDSYH